MKKNLLFKNILSIAFLTVLSVTLISCGDSDSTNQGASNSVKNKDDFFDIDLKKEKGKEKESDLIKDEEDYLEEEIETTSYFYSTSEKSGELTLLKEYGAVVSKEDSEETIQLTLKCQEVDLTSEEKVIKKEDLLTLKNIPVAEYILEETANFFKNSSEIKGCAINLRPGYSFKKDGDGQLVLKIKGQKEMILVTDHN